MLVVVVLFGQMLDAGYWTLDIQECTDGESRIIEYLSEAQAP
jgi:hypothetical protein